jgi:uncharacterized protein (TIGR04222 family)
VNPLDWTGPEFLLFYFVWGGAVLLLGRAWRVAAEGGAGRVTLSDPYLIAHLRSGADEALRVALLALLDRGLLVTHDDELKRREGVGPDSVRRPIEKAVLTHFAEARPLDSVFERSAAGAATDELEITLVEHGLLPGAAEQAARRGRLWLSLAALLVPAVAKLFVALARGRSNVVFLIGLAALFAFLLARDAFPRRTARGDALLADLRTLFAGLRSRAASLKSGGATAEVALLAAVFGLGALPQAPFGALLGRLASFQRPGAHDSSSASSCGATCGSGSWGSADAATAGAGDSGGSSCGGGCGGGCGGCGG